MNENEWIAVVWFFSWIAMGTAFMAWLVVQMVLA